MRVIVGLVGFVWLVFTMVSAAQVQVLGTSRAAQCYTAVKSGVNNTAQTVGVCGDAIKFDQTSPRDRTASYVNRGVVQMRRGTFADAQSDFEKALERAPQNAEAHLNLGAVLIYQNDTESAIEALKTALALGTVAPHAAHYNLGLAYEKTGDLTAAYDSFSKAKTLKPEWSMVDEQLERFILETSPRDE